MAQKFVYTKVILLFFVVLIFQKTTGQEYGQDFRVFAEAMKKIDPMIKVGAVVHAKDKTWNSQVLKEVQDHADYLIVHHYFVRQKEKDANVILNSVPDIQKIANTLRRHVVNFTDKPRNHFPLALTEFNARGPHEVSMTNGLFITQVLGEIIKPDFSTRKRFH